MDEQAKKHGGIALYSIIIMLLLLLTSAIDVVFALFVVSVFEIAAFAVCIITGVATDA